MMPYTHSPISSYTAQKIAQNNGEKPTPHDQLRNTVQQNQNHLDFSTQLLDSEGVTTVLNCLLNTSKTELVSLNLSNSRINKEHIQLLGRVLEKHPNLHELTLNNCGIDNTEFTLLAEILAKYNTVENLSLADNFIRYSSFLDKEKQEKNANYVSAYHQLIKCNNLKQLNLNNNPLCGGGIFIQGLLKTLNLNALCIDTPYFLDGDRKLIKQELDTHPLWQQVVYMPGPAHFPVHLAEFFS